MEELKMFNTEEVSKMLNMRVDLVRDLRKIGVLEAIRTGQSYMFSREAILEFQRDYKGKDVSNVKNAVIAMNEVMKKKLLVPASNSKWNYPIKFHLYYRWN